MDRLTAKHRYPGVPAETRRFDEEGLISTGNSRRSWDSNNCGSFAEFSPEFAIIRRSSSTVPARSTRSRQPSCHRLGWNRLVRKTH